MYHNFFGLNEQAFSIAVNPRYLYMSDQHREALAHLLYGIQIGGFVLLTGEVGTGKTTIIRCLLEQLPDNTDIAIILNPMASAPELLCTICDELDVRYIVDNWGVKDLTDALHHYLMENHRKGRKTVLLIDEAQLLKPTVLEQIRLLTNLETTTEKLLQIILVGQPELKKLLARPSLRQLSQRITARFHLEALSLAETHAYITHRLRIAGLAANRNPFTDDIIKKIHQFSGGIPRLINIICERILLGAYARNRTVADDEIFEQAALEVSGTKSSVVVSKALPEKWLYGLAGVAVTALLALLIWALMPDTSPSQPITATKSVITSGNPSSASVQASSAQAQSGQEPAALAGQTATDLSSSDLLSSNLASTDLASRDQASSSSGSAVTDAEEQGQPTTFWTRDSIAAHKELLGYLGISPTGVVDPCAPTAGHNFTCEREKIATWNELKDVNRPAVLTLVTDNKKLAYVVVIGLGEDKVLVLHDGKEVTLTWDSLASNWNGEISYAWYRPASFSTPISAGHRGEIVNWLADQFVKLDQQDSPLTRNVYNDKLKKRVELFQSSYGMKPDGIVGAQTLRRLNEVLGIDKVLVEVTDNSSASSPDESE